MTEETPPVRLDLGCGPNKKEGFTGCDQYAMEGVDHVFNIGQDRWPFEDNSAEEAHASHFVEHLDVKERCHFVNELYRVLKPGGKCAIIVPCWSSNRAYGDPTHKWPPVSQMWFFYLLRDWRLGNKEKNIGANAPHTDKKWLEWGFDCDFEATFASGMHPMLHTRNPEFQQLAIQFCIEATQDIHATLVKK